MACTLRGWVIRGISLILLTTLAVSARAADSSEERATLKGIPGVAVVVDLSSPDGQRDEVAKRQIQAGVERLLLTAGIALMPTAAEHLYLGVLLVRSKEGIYAYSLFLELNQPLFLMRESRIVNTATWKVSGLGLVGQRNLPGTLWAHVAALVDQFIAAYRQQNPRE
jgi:hypothetical protein